MDTSIVAKGGLSKVNDKLANSVDPDETARYKLFHQDLHCLQRYPCWSAGMKGQTENDIRPEMVQYRLLPILDSISSSHHTLEKMNFNFSYVRICYLDIPRAKCITKTCLLKYIENFATKKMKNFQLKIRIFFIFLLKT